LVLSNVALSLFQKQNIMTLKNQKVYYLPCVRFIADFQSYSSSPVFKKGQEFPIFEDTLALDKPDSEICIIQYSDFANNIWRIPVSVVETFVKLIKPKFKIGDIVLKKGTELPFRIFEHQIMTGRIWYREGWSLVSGCEGGATEDKLDLCDAQQRKIWSATYYDKDVVKKFPHLAYAIN
jgi:hypothetical protein